jgi:hypothetical protein
VVTESEARQQLNAERRANPFPAKPPRQQLRSLTPAELAELDRLYPQPSPDRTEWARQRQTSPLPPEEGGA